MTTAIIIDDNNLTVQVLRDYVEMVGIRVLGCGHDGRDAVNLYKMHKPDIVFLDLMMPHYDGFFALESIRMIDKDAKVIVVTSDLRKETSERLDGLKPTRIIYKPFAVQEIRQVLEKIAGNKEN